MLIWTAAEAPSLTAVSIFELGANPAGSVISVVPAETVAVNRDCTGEHEQIP